MFNHLDSFLTLGDYRTLFGIWDRAIPGSIEKSSLARFVNTRMAVGRNLLDLSKERITSGDWNTLKAITEPTPAALDVLAWTNQGEQPYGGYFAEPRNAIAIPCRKGYTVSCKSFGSILVVLRYYCELDANGKILYSRKIWPEMPNVGATITATDDNCYMLCIGWSMDNPDVSNMVIVEGSTIPTAYYPYFAPTTVLPNAKIHGYTKKTIVVDEKRYIVPDDVTLLNSAYNSASTSVDTGIKAQNNMEMFVRVKAITGSFYIFQSRQTSGANIYGISGAQAGNTINFFDVTSGITRTEGHIYTIKGTYNNGAVTLYVKDETTGAEDTKTGMATTSRTFPSPTTIKLFGDASLLAAYASIYRAYIKIDGTMVWDAHPAKKNNKVGVYNLIDEEFILPNGELNAYTGNAPIELYGVGDKTEQLFGWDASECIKLNAKFESSTVTADNNRWCVFIPVVGGKTYTIKNFNSNHAWSLCQLDTNSVTLGQSYVIDGVNTFVYLNAYTTYTITTNTKAKWLGIAITEAKNTGENILKTQIVAVKGSTIPTEYIPYGYSVDILVDETKHTVILSHQLHGFDDNEDIFDFQTGIDTSVIGVRPYQTGDENNLTVITDKVMTYYHLATPTTTTIPVTPIALTAKGEHILKNTNIIKGSVAVTYLGDPEPPPKAVKFRAVQANSTIALTGAQDTNYKYSTDGKTFNTYTSGTTITLANIGDAVWFQGVHNENVTYSMSTGRYSQFTITGKIAASGNIDWLLDPEFDDANGTLPTYCYCRMFRACTSLTEAPELPAAKLANYCYYSMFQGCTSLTSAPELPATTLANYCYQSMFRGCTNLTVAPELPVTALVSGCYQDMFYGCTSLTEAPELPATTLAYYCYQTMFQGCTSLIEAPELPATTLAGYCYQQMFSGCTSLTSAPELPATTLVNGCYRYMFQNASNLNYVVLHATDISATNCLASWLQNVKSTGTLKCPASITLPSGESGLPSGWTRVNL